MSLGGRSEEQGVERQRESGGWFWTGVIAAELVGTVCGLNSCNVVGGGGMEFGGAMVLFNLILMGAVALASGGLALAAVFAGHKLKSRTGARVAAMVSVLVALTWVVVSRSQRQAEPEPAEQDEWSEDPYPDDDY